MSEPIPAPAIWIDLLRPDDAARDAVTRQTGLRVPTLADLNEIETSSRLALRDDAIYLSLPMAAPGREGVGRPTPLGIVLTPDRLVTVRFDGLYVFDFTAPAARAAEAGGQGSAFILTLLLEATVDHLADVLQRIGEDLDHVSGRIFHTEDTAPQPPNRGSAELRATLRTVGLTVEGLTRVRETLLSLARIPPFLTASAPWLPAEVRTRLKVLRSDVASLNEHIAHHLGQGQFLQDAMLGFISIEQSNIIKVMTVVSVIGVPPTLIASIYGMNFEHMPELHWPIGYPLALLAIVASGVLPVLWFRRLGWL